MNNPPKPPDASLLALLAENRQLRAELDTLRAEKFAMRERQINDSVAVSRATELPLSFSAVFVHDGQVRRMTFDAADITEARSLAARWGVGVEGEVARGEIPELPVAYGMAKARQILGGVSRSQVYVWLTLRRLERLPGTRRVLITRESVEKFQRRTAA